MTHHDIREFRPKFEAISNQEYRSAIEKHEAKGAFSLVTPNIFRAPDGRVYWSKGDTFKVSAGPVSRRWWEFAETFDITAEFDEK